MLDIELLEAKEYNVLFNKYKGYIYKFVSEFNNIDSVEVISSCNIGFTKAIKTFKPSKGRFGTFLYSCMKNEILCYIKSLNKTNYACSLDKEISENGDSFLNVEKSNIDVEKLCIERVTITNFLNKIDGKKRGILLSRLMGYTGSEIARYTGYSRRYIYKLQKQAYTEGIRRGLI